MRRQKAESRRDSSPRGHHVVHPARCAQRQAQQEGNGALRGRVTQRARKSLRLTSSSSVSLSLNRRSCRRTVAPHSSTHALAVARLVIPSWTILCVRAQLRVSLMVNPTPWVSVFMTAFLSLHCEFRSTRTPFFSPCYPTTGRRSIYNIVWQLRHAACCALSRFEQISRAAARAACLLGSP